MGNPFFDLLTKATANARVPRMFPGGEEATNVGEPQDYLAEARRYIDTSPQGAPYRNPFLYYNAETMQGQPTFWGRHPRVTNALEGVMTTLGSMGPTGSTAGENVSNVARSLMAYPQLRAQHEQQQLMAPYQLASSMMGMRKTQMEMRKMGAESEAQRAHAKFWEQYGNFRQAQAENYAQSVEARLVAAYGRANLKPVLNEQGQLQGYNVLTPHGMVFHSAMGEPAQPTVGPGGEPIPPVGTAPTQGAPAAAPVPGVAAQPPNVSPLRTPSPGLYTEGSYRATKGGNLWSGSTSVVIAKLHAAGMHKMAQDLEATATRLIGAGATARAQGEGKVPEREKLTFQSYEQGIDEEIVRTEMAKLQYTRSLDNPSARFALRERRAEAEQEAARLGENADQLKARLATLEPDFDSKLQNLRDARKSLVGAFSEAAPAKAPGSPMPAPKGPKVGETKTYQGITYKFDGTQYVRQ